MMDYSIVQQIAKGVVESSAACDGQLFTGKVTSASPLKIKLSNEAGGIELDGDDIILTSAVVSKKLYIKKHTHGENERLVDVQGTTAAGPVIFAPAGELPSPTIPNPDPPPDTIPNPDFPTTPSTLTLKHKHTIETTVVDGWVTEYGHKLDVSKDDERIVITINRSLEEGDSVIMTRVSHGQQFIVLSRYFPVDSPGEDDE